MVPHPPSFPVSPIPVRDPTLHDPDQPQRLEKPENGLNLQRQGQGGRNTCFHRILTFRLRFRAKNRSPATSRCESGKIRRASGITVSGSSWSGKWVSFGAFRLFSEFFDDGNQTSNFLSIMKELEAPGYLEKDTKFKFNFHKFEKQYETY
jgi:hypothetical protein